MKVAILGGAAFCTPAMFEALRGDLSALEFVLVGRSLESLRTVARASTLLAGEPAPRITSMVAEPLSSAAALEGASVVLIQMRIGNLAGREFDESFPLRFGLCGDEGLGPGGLSAGWRSWPVIERWLQAIREHAPKALVLMMSSPVGILVRAARLRFPDLNCQGICEVPFVTLREISTGLKLPQDAIAFAYFGVNHLGWLYSLRAFGRDLEEEWAHHPGRTGFPSAAIIEEWGGIPTKYLRLHFEESVVLESQRSLQTSRARDLQALQNGARLHYPTGSAAQLRQMLARRATPWYADAIVPLLRGLHQGNAPGPFFLSGPNRGYSSACAAEDILEIACRVTNGVLERIPLIAPPPPRIAELVSQFCQHECVATQAVVKRQSSLLTEALSVHPWVARAAGSIDGLASRLAAQIV